MSQFNKNVKEICNLNVFNPIGIKIFKYVYSVKDVIKTKNYSLIKLIFESTFGKLGNIYIHFDDIDLLLDAIETNDNDIIYLVLNYYNDYQIYKNMDNILSSMIHNNNFDGCKEILSRYNVTFTNLGELDDGYYSDDESDYYNLKYQIRSNYTSLYCAVQSGNFKFVKLLLKLGANPNLWSDSASDNEGKLPLHAAIKANNYKMAKLLVLNGAKPDKSLVTDYYNDDYENEIVIHHSPLHYAIREYKIKFIKLFKHYCESITNEEYLQLKKEKNNHEKFISTYTECQYNLLEKYD